MAVSPPSEKVLQESLRDDIAALPEAVELLGATPLDGIQFEYAEDADQRPVLVIGESSELQYPSDIPGHQGTILVHIEAEKPAGGVRSDLVTNYDSEMITEFGPPFADILSGGTTVQVAKGAPLVEVVGFVSFDFSLYSAADFAAVDGSSLVLDVIKATGIAFGDSELKIYAARPDLSPLDDAQFEDYDLDWPDDDDGGSDDGDGIVAATKTNGTLLGTYTSTHAWVTAAAGSVVSFDLDQTGNAEAVFQAIKARSATNRRLLLMFEITGTGRIEFHFQSENNVLGFAKPVIGTFVPGTERQNKQWFRDVTSRLMGALHQSKGTLVITAIRVVGDVELAQDEEGATQKFLQRSYEVDHGLQGV